MNPILDDTAAPEMPMDMDEAPPPPPNYDAEVNLVEVIQPMPQAAEFAGGEAWLEAVGQLVISHKKIDWESSAEYRRRRQRHVELFTGGYQGWSGGQKNIIYLHMPYLTKAVLLFHSKMYRNNFPASGDIVGVEVAQPGEDARARERRMSRHLNWYLRKVVKEYVTEHDRGGIQILLYGDAVSVWFYDPVEKRWRFEFCKSDDIIVPYSRESGPPDMSDLPRITWVKRMHRHELEAAADPGDDGAPYYANVDKLYPDPYGSAGEATSGTGGAPLAPSPSVRQTVEQRQGVKPPTGDDGDQPRVLLEQDRWLALPGEKRQRPVTICVDETTGIVLRLTLREIEDPKDVERHTRETSAMQATHEADMADHQADLDAHQQHLGMLEQMRDPETGMLPSDVPLPGEPPPPPPPPPFETIKPPRRKPMHRFTHYVCIPNQEGGYYGYGLGYLIEGHNIASNEVMTLYTSLMRMNLMPTFFFPRMNNRKADIKLKLGEGNPLPLMPGEMKGAIEWVQFPPPDPNAFKVEERQARAVQEITADDVIGGAPGLSGQTATETQERVSNAMDNIAMISSRVNRSRTNEVQVLARLLSTTLDEEGETFTVKTPVDQAPMQQPMGPPPMGPPGMPPGMPPEAMDMMSPGAMDMMPPEMGPPEPAEPPGTELVEEYTVTREDYVDSFDVYVTADPNLSSQPQREQKAIKLITSLQQIPPETFDPTTSALVWRAAATKLMKAMGEDDIVQLIANAPLPQPQQMGPPPTGGGEGNGNGPVGGPGAAPEADVAGGPGDAAGAAEPPPMQ